MTVRPVSADLSLEPAPKDRQLALVKDADPQLLSALAHELRDPLAPLANCLHVIEEAQRQRTECGRAVALMKRQLDRLMRIADELSEAARIGREQMHLRRERVDLSEVLRRAADASARSGRRRPALRLSDGSLRIDVDPIRLSRVLSMLMDAVAAAPGRRAMVTAHADATHVEIRIVGEREGPATVRALAAVPETPRARLSRSVIEHVVELHGGTVGPFGNGYCVRLPLDGSVSPA